MSATPSLETLPDSSTPAPQDDDIDFLESPIDDILDKDLTQMSLSETEAMLAAIKDLRAPGALQRELKIEAGSVALGKPKPKRAPKKSNINLADLL